MDTIVEFSSRGLRSYKRRIKYLLKEIEELDQHVVTESLVNFYMGKFLKTVRECRNFSLEDMASISKIDEVRLMYIEQYIIKVTEKEWFKLIHLLNAELAADQLMQTLQETKNPQLRESRKQLAKVRIEWGFYDPFDRRPSVKKESNILELGKAPKDTNTATRT